jgi:hypothetical protein
MKVSTGQQATVRGFRAVLIAIALILAWPGTSYAGEPLRPDLLRSSLPSITTYLSSQMVPNRVVPQPHPDRQGLVLSYTIDSADTAFRYMGRRSAVYDNALAVIAMVMTGHYRGAEAIVQALDRSAPRPRAGKDDFRDGDLWFFLNTHNAYPSPDDNHGAVIRTGANCWVGYAVTYMLRTAITKNPDTMSDPRVQRYLAFAERVAHAVLSRQINDPGDPRHGLVTGGWGTFKHELKGNKTVEKFVPGEVQWCSTEHNINAYFFLRDLGALTGQRRYTAAADRIRKSLLHNFNHETGQLNRGVGANGPDTMLALDTASWGVLFLIAAGERGLATRSLEATDRYRNQSSGLWGYRPTADATVYEVKVLQDFYYPNNPRQDWDDTPLVWSEGSLGVALASLRLGETARAKKIITAMLGRHMNRSGGLRYADRPIEQLFSDAPSVAGSAWAVFVLKQLQGERFADMLWDTPADQPATPQPPRR